MRTIITMIDGRDAAKSAHYIRAAELHVDRHALAVERERQRLLAAPVSFGIDPRKKLAEYDAERAKGRTRHYSSVEECWSLSLADKALRAAKLRLDAARSEAAKPERPDLWRITCLDSFDLKDELKERGYHFDREAHWRDPVGAKKPLAGWVLVIPVDDVDRMAEEIVWLRERGPVEANSILNRLSETARARLQA